MANLKRGLIVSCQAVKGEPLYGLNMMHHFARAAVEGGAAGIRANYVDDITAIKKEVSVPVIGIIKAVYPDSDIYITPTLTEVKALLTTGCEVIAVDATLRPRPNGATLQQIVDYVRTHAPSVELMADTADFDEAQNAARLGFDYIGSTLRGYTPSTAGIRIPDCSYLSKLVTSFPNIKIIAEGGIWDAEALKKVCETGVYAVVIGSAITRPKDITAHFNEVMQLC